MRLVGILKDILTLKFVNAAARILAILVIIVNICSIVRKRSYIQNIKKEDDSFLLKVFSEKYLFGKQKINV